MKKKFKDKQPNELKQVSLKEVETIRPIEDIDFDEDIADYKTMKVNNEEGSDEDNVDSKFTKETDYVIQ